MTVYARSANDLMPPATAGLVDVRRNTDLRAGTFPYAGPDTVSPWHTHDLHQLEYAFTGAVEVETASADYLLPPQQAVWVPAGVAHRTTLVGVRSVSVFFHPDLVPDAGDRARVLAAAPVIREMILYGQRWPITRMTSDPTADTYFEALALIVSDWLEHETPLCLPTSTDEIVAAVMAFTRSHLNEISSRQVSEAVGISERTLRRRFVAATGMSWNRYLTESRMLRAMALLAETGPTVLDVATAVGFESVSAFTRAFGQYSGETPTQYRQRVTAGPIDPPRSAAASART